MKPIKLRFLLLALPFGMLTAINCGARTPMDSFTDSTGANSGGTGGGGGTGNGGNGGSGGYWPATGGNEGGGGLKDNTGGSIFGGGGYRTEGGAIRGGGALGGRGGTNLGGTFFVTGGYVNTGGNTGGVFGRDGGPEVRSDAMPDLRDAGRDGLGGSGGSISTGGRIGTGGSTGPDAGTCPGLAANEEMIDDLNDGDRFLPMINGRVGAWSGSHDNSPSGKMSPDPSGSFAPTNTGDTCRKYAMYVSGGAYVLWGADFWFSLGSPYDASKYTGISFWARVDRGTTDKIRVAFPDKDTQPDGNLCSTASTAGANACYDHYGARLTMSSTWTKYTIKFSQLETQNWGRAGTGFDPSSLYEVLFQISSTANFGIWIDDPAFTF